MDWFSNLPNLLYYSFLTPQHRKVLSCTYKENECLLSRFPLSNNYFRLPYQDECVWADINSIEYQWEKEGGEKQSRPHLRLQQNNQFSASLSKKISTFPFSAFNSFSVFGMPCRSRTYHFISLRGQMGRRKWHFVSYLLEDDCSLCWGL